MPAAVDKRPIKVVTASNFHSRDSIKRLKSNCQQLAVQHHTATASITRQQRRRFNPLKAPFKTFKTQKEAFDFLDSQPCSQILRTFACEVSATGQRTFIVSTAELFWQHYKALPSNCRHHYEIIREARPCSLYFDLEYCPRVNPGLDGASLVQLLVSGIAEQLRETFDIPWDNTYVLELDSSTEQKFSRHLIIRLPGLAFADCCHAGRFARLVLLRLLQQGQHRSQPCQLLVQEKGGQGLTSFIDMGVYTRNRAFRLFLSSKYGKQACLRLTQRFAGAKIDPQDAFHHLLISMLHSPCSISTSKVALASRPLYQHAAVVPLDRSQPAASGSAAQGAISLLYVDDIDWQTELQQLPTAWQHIAMLQLNPVPHNQQHHGLSQQQQQRYCGGSVRTQGWGQAGAMAQATVCHGPSPYPLLEQFILAICRQGGVQGEIRSWLTLPGCVVFNIKNNRWCDNIGRPHKSNGIYYVADLEAGVYYQKCYDPSCRNYRSHCLPLPPHIWNKYRQHSDGAGEAQTSAEQDFSQHGIQAEQREDELMLQLLLQVEQQHQQQHGGTCAADGQRSASMDNGGSHWSQNSNCDLQPFAVAAAAISRSVSMGRNGVCGLEAQQVVGHCNGCGDGEEVDDELCLQLLHEVEGSLACNGVA